MRNCADKKHGLKLNFSSSHANYFSAWKYTTKDDKDYLESECHTDLKNASQTQEARQACIAEIGGNEKCGKKRKQGRQPQLTIYEVSQAAVQKGINSRLEFLSLANQQKKEDKTYLDKFIASLGYKAVEEALQGRMGNGRGSR